MAETIIERVALFRQCSGGLCLDVRRVGGQRLPGERMKQTTEK